MNINLVKQKIKELQKDKSKGFLGIDYKDFDKESLIEIIKYYIWLDKENRRHYEEYMSELILK